MTKALTFHDPATSHGRGALIAALKAGGVAALPTETVPGLAVIAGGRERAAALARLKGAPLDRPFSLHLRGLAELEALLPAPPPRLAPWLAERLPGPLTVIVPREWVALPGSWDWPWATVGLRVPAGPEWTALARELPGPLLMTSLNPHGTPPLSGAELDRWLGAHPEVACGLRPTDVAPRSASRVLAFEPLPRFVRGASHPGERLPGLRVLVVCTGNICRSPLAAALLERELAAAWGTDPLGLTRLGWRISSAGSYAMPGSPASDHAVKAAAEIGLELRGHRAQHLEDALRSPWDLVLGMSASHLQAAGAQRVELFDPLGHEIADPFGSDLAAYRLTRDHLARAVEQRVQAWSEWPRAASGR